MAKKPTVTLISSGHYSAETITANFTALRDAFDNTISRDGSAPNTMAGDLDMDSNDIINVGTIDIANLTVNGVDYTNIFDDPFGLGDLSLTRGDIIFFNGTTLQVLNIGTADQVLRVNSGATAPEWVDEVDNDTVGVTIEEDGVVRQTNTTIINFLTDQNIVSSPESGVVEVDLSTFIESV